jgi:hypothetical protein
MKKLILSLFLTIVLTGAFHYGLKGEKTSCKFQSCTPTSENVNNYPIELPPYYPFFIKL